MSIIHYPIPLGTQLLLSGLLVVIGKKEGIPFPPPLQPVEGGYLKK